MTPPKVSAVIFREGDYWVAQVLEYDLATQARSLKDLQYGLQRTLIGHVVASTEADQVPFERLAPAPKRDWEMFATAYVLEYEHVIFLLPNGPASPKAELRISA